MANSTCPPSSNLRLSGKELEEAVREEKRKWRIFRLQQVREQARVEARRVRGSVDRRKKDMVQKVGKELLQKWQDDKENKVQQLQQEYDECFRAFGKAHEQAKEQPDAVEMLAENMAINSQKAARRGREAAQLQKVQNAEKEREKKAVHQRKNAAIQKEKIRASRVAQLPMPKAFKKEKIVVPKPVPKVQLYEHGTLTTTSYIPKTVVIEKEIKSTKPSAHQLAEVEENALRSARESKRNEVVDIERKREERGMAALNKERLHRMYRSMLEELDRAQHDHQLSAFIRGTDCSINETEESRLRTLASRQREMETAVERILREEESRPAGVEESESGVSEEASDLKEVSDDSKLGGMSETLITKGMGLRELQEEIRRHRHLVNRVINDLHDSTAREREPEDVDVDDAENLEVREGSDTQLHPEFSGSSEEPSQMESRIQSVTPVSEVESRDRGFYVEREKDRRVPSPVRPKDRRDPSPVLPKDRRDPSPVLPKDRRDPSPVLPKDITAQGQTDDIHLTETVPVHLLPENSNYRRRAIIDSDSSSRQSSSGFSLQPGSTDDIEVRIHLSSDSSISQSPPPPDEHGGHIVDDTRRPRGYPVIDDTRRHREYPVVDDTKRPREYPIIDDTRRHKEYPIVDDTKRPREYPIIDDTKRPREYPTVDTERPREYPIIDDAKRPREYPIVDDTRRPREYPIVDDTKQPREYPWDIYCGRNSSTEYLSLPSSFSLDKERELHRHNLEMIEQRRKNIQRLLDGRRHVEHKGMESPVTYMQEMTPEGSGHRPLSRRGKFEMKKRELLHHYVRKLLNLREDELMQISASTVEGSGFTVSSLCTLLESLDKVEEDSIFSSLANLTESPSSEIASSLAYPDIDQVPTKLSSSGSDLSPNIIPDIPKFTTQPDRDFVTKFHQETDSESSAHLHLKDSVAHTSHDIHKPESSCFGPRTISLPPRIQDIPMVRPGPLPVDESSITSTTSDVRFEEENLQREMKILQDLRILQRLKQELLAKKNSILKEAEELEEVACYSDTTISTPPLPQRNKPYSTGLLGDSEASKSSYNALTPATRDFGSSLHQVEKRIERERSNIPFHRPTRPVRDFQDGPVEGKDTNDSEDNFVLLKPEHTLASTCASSADGLRQPPGEFSSTATKFRPLLPQATSQLEEITYSTQRPLLPVGLTTLSLKPVEQRGNSRDYNNAETRYRDSSFPEEIRQVYEQFPERRTPTEYERVNESNIESVISRERSTPSSDVRESSKSQSTTSDQHTNSEQDVSRPPSSNNSKSQKSSSESVSSIPDMAEILQRFGLNWAESMIRKMDKAEEHSSSGN